MENRTGVYYQAMPAVGPDGKNVMKLIPVQKVNGKFVQTQVYAARKDGQPQIYSDSVSLLQNKLPRLQTIPDGRVILRTVPESSALSNSVKSQQQVTSSLSKNATSPVCSPEIALRPTENAFLQSNRVKAVTMINSPRLTLAMQSPVFPSGHYLQIPPNATVSTVAASALPQSIKNQIGHSDAVSNPANSLPTVMYVSPVNSLGPDSHRREKSCKTWIPPLVPGPTELPQSLSHTPSTGTAKNFNLSSTSSPKTGQGVTPIKWVVQEGSGSAAPCLIPITSPKVAPDVTKQMDTASAVFPEMPASTHTIQEKITQGKDNALLMCNGNIYFLAKKTLEISKDVISGTGSKQPVRNAAQSSATGPCADSNSLTKQDPKSAEKKPSEIIDLCDDDEDTSAASSRLTVLGEAAGENDEDSNVIFVSYIPPKSDTDTSRKVAETAQEKERESTGRPECVAENVDDGSEKSNTNSPFINDLNVSGCQDKPVTSVEEEGAVPEEDACGQGTEMTQELAVDSVIQCEPSGKAFAEMSLEQPVPEEVPRQRSDSELRRIFGITSELRIRLQRINQVKEQSHLAESTIINKDTLEDMRKLMQDSQIELKIKHLIQTQAPVSSEDIGPKEAKRKRLEQNGEQNLDSCPSVVTRSSSPQLDDPANSDAEMQSVSTDAFTGCNISPCCHLEKETPSTSGSSGSPGSSSCSSFQQLKKTARSHADGAASVSRKTPARHSKGSGRVCTACPCGTKVGAIVATPSSKPQDKPKSDSSNQAKVLSEPKISCRTVNKVLESSDSSPPTSSATEEKAQSIPSPPKPGRGPSRKASFRTVQVEGARQPGVSSNATKCSPSPSSAQGKTRGPAAAPTQKPNLPKEVKVQATPPSVAGILNREIVPTEYYPSIMLDPEEVKRRERIRHLKDLLKQKEAALEKLRKSM